MKAIPIQAALAAYCLTSVSAQAAVSAKDFADSHGLVSETKAREFLVCSGKIAAAPLMKTGKMEVDHAKFSAATADMISYWRDTFGAPPWRWQDLQGPETDPGPKLCPGITSPLEWEAKDGHASTGSRGPWRLRKNLDEAKKDTYDEDQEKMTELLKGVEGATLGFKHNRQLKGNGAWNSEGALAYPVNWAVEHPQGGSTAFTFLPTIAWKVAQTEEISSKDVEDLSFHLPLNAYRTFQHFGGIDFQFDPYYNTDFSWGHEIYGSTASTEYIGDVFGLFQTGGWARPYTDSKWKYQLRLVGNLDWNQVAEAGPHTTRTVDEDWLRLGGKIALDVQLGSGDLPIVVGASFEALEEIDGNGGSGSLFDAYITWPFTQHTALKLNYQNGDTPVSDQAIDLITLGLEVKF